MLERNREKYLNNLIEYGSTHDWTANQVGAAYRIAQKVWKECSLDTFYDEIIEIIDTLKLKLSKSSGLSELYDIITKEEFTKSMAEAVKESADEIGKEYPEISELLQGMMMAALKTVVDQVADAIFEQDKQDKQDKGDQ